MKSNETRKPEHQINNLLLNRWSPRAMSGEKISKEELMQLFEAAKWAPSSYNEQPWRFLYAEKESEYWDEYFDLLVEFNQQWCKNAAVLVVVLSKKTFNHDNSPNIVHAFDAGAAWENLALQAETMDLIAHGMAGFDYKKTKTVLNVPDNYYVDCMIAIGKPGNKEDLPEAMQEREFPSSRKPLKELVFEGKFPE